ncbi:hypothetical protein BH23DEI1_BH23DEI1_11610 [soil metagenome]
MSAVARLVGEDPRRTYYFVRRYLALGLLEEVARTARWGKSIRTYAATADGFFVPVERFPTPDLAEAMDDLYVPILRAFNRAAADVAEAHLRGVWGRRFRLDDGGTMIPEGAPDPAYGDFRPHEFYAREGFPPVWTWWQEVHLTPVEAKELQRDLIALGQRLPNGRRAGTRRYLVRTGMTPFPEHGGPDDT